MTHPPVPWQLKIAMTTTRKAHTRTEKESCISSRSKPHSFSQITHEYSSHSSQIPPFHFNPSIYLMSLPELGWEVDLRTRFLLLHSLAIEWSLCCSSLSIGFITGRMNPIRKRTFLAETRGLCPDEDPGMGPVNKFSNNLTCPLTWEVGS